MQNELRHAEGWTKKNHKYIRKEGNRYIYPEDLQTNRARREGISRRQTEFEEYHRQRRENRQNALNQQGSSDYKKLSQQHANRQAAANGKVVNPSYTLRDNEGNKIARLQSKDKVPSPNQADYKQYSKEMSNQAKQKRAAGSPNEYVQNQEHAKKMTNIMRSPAINPVKYKDGIGPSPDSLHRRKNAMKKQGAGTDYKTLSTKYNQEQNRKKAANGGPSKHGVLYYNKSNNSLDKDYYTSDQEWAKDRTSKGSGRSIRTKDQLNQKKRSKALNSQGSVNRQQESKAKNPNPSKPYVSDDYKKELEYNSRKNVYPEKIETEKIEVEKSDKDWSKENAKKKSSRTSKLKDRVSKALSNLKNKKKKSK